QLSQAAIAAGQAGAIQSQLGYTRGFEREADRVGLQTLEQAGFDVRGMPGFFERLQRDSRLYENNAPAYLRTHPLTTERIADMENRASSMPYRQVLDSPDFGYARAKLRAQAGAAADTLRQMQEGFERNPGDPAARYGLGRALLRAGRFDEAAAVVDPLRANVAPSPWVDTLAAEIRLARKDGAGALALLERARQRHPGHRSLEYALAEAQIQAGQPAAAVAGMRKALAQRGGDARLWLLLSRANAELGRRTAQHRAQAEVYLLRGSLPAAIEQLELARKAGDGDFYELSAVDARLRELKVRLREEREAERN
ncbi:MAG: tetratricopeptide repeat protein, partial [Thauera phenolivorans]|nr:tetratricopeptide repeat protein [Thauera phenolivorans]